MGIYINDEELRVMRGISPAARSAYLFMRARMDWRTGLVGRVTKISLFAVGEDQEYEVPKGRGTQLVKLADTTDKVKEAARRLIEVLERVGLIVKRACAFLTFFCPMASLASARPNQTGHERATPLPTKRATPPIWEESSIGAGFEAVDWPEMFERATPPDCWDGSNGPHIVDQGKTTPRSSSTPLTGVGPAAGGGGVNRDRPMASQAGSLGRPGDTTNDFYRDRPQGASHPAQARRSGGDAPPLGASADHRDGETDAGLAENESPRFDPAPEDDRAALLHEVLRGERIIRPDAVPVVGAWVEADVSADELREAIRRARASRMKDDSLQPINLPMLSTILKSVRSGARRAVDRVRREAEKARTTPQQADLETLARSLGMWPARPGEETADFRVRVMAVLDKQGASGG